MPAAAPLLLPPLLILATTVSLASAARPAPANPSLQSAASAPVATDVEPGDAAGKLLVTKVVVIQLVFFHISPLLVDAGILSLLTNADNHFPSDVAIYSTKFEM